MRLADLPDPALVVVDMQNDFVEHGGYYAAVGSGVEPVREAASRIAKLHAAAVLSMPIVWTRMEYLPDAMNIPSDPVDNHSILPEMFSKASIRLREGTWGAAISPLFAAEEQQGVVVSKHGYSAFYQTRLEAILRRAGVKTLVLTGVASNGCVLHTAFDGFVRDFDVVLVEDATASYWPDLHEAALSIVAGQLGVVTHSDALLADA